MDENNINPVEEGLELEKAEDIITEEANNANTEPLLEDNSGRNNRNKFLILCAIAIGFIILACGLLGLVKGSGNTIKLNDFSDGVISDTVTIKLPKDYVVDTEGYVYKNEDGVIYNNMMMYVEEVDEEEFLAYMDTLKGLYPVEESEVNGAKVFTLVNIAENNNPEEAIDYAFVYKNGVFFELDYLESEISAANQIIKSLSVK